MTLEKFKGSRWPVIFLLPSLLFSCKFYAAKNADHPIVIKKITAQTERLLKISPKKAIAYLDTSFKKIPNPGPGDYQAKYDLLRQYYFDYSNNSAMALLYTDSILYTLQPYTAEKPYNILYAETQLNRGDILFKEKRFEEAYLEYYQAKSSLKPTGNDCDYQLFMFDFYNRLANISFGKSRFLESNSWHKKAVAVMLACGSDPNQSLPGSYNNIALNYNYIGKLDSSLYYYDKALQTLAMEPVRDSSQKQNNEITRGVIAGNEGSVYFLQGKLALAEQKFKEDIAINDRPGYAVQDALETRLKLAELYIKAKQLPQADMMLKQIAASRDTMPEPQDKLQLLKISAAYASTIGNHAQAYTLLQQYVLQLNALRKANRSLMSADFVKEFELLKRDFELQDLKKQNQLKNLCLAVFALICLMAVAIIYLILRGSRQAKANARQEAQHSQELEITLSALEKSNYENMQLMSVVAHDLKNPIGAIYGISAIMMDDEGRSAEDMEMLRLIKVSSKNLDLIIHDLLAERINKSSGYNKKVHADLLDLLTESVSLLQYRAEEKKQKIILIENDNCSVNINKDRVWRVINNLIVNAIKFSPENTTIRISWQNFEKEVVVCIKDEGIGIPDELKEKIFHLSTEAKRQGTSGEETFGMGLYISKQIIEDQGGRIWVESTPGQGTAFYFSLPLA